MSVWFLLWLFLSLTLLYFFGWTLFIIHRQKQAWSVFAKKKGLRYVAGGFSEAPQMEGVVDDYAVSFFPAQYELGDVRHNRKMTAVELTLHGDMPFEGFIASGMLIDAAKTAGLPQEVKPKHEKWNDQNIVLTDNIAAMEAYLTPERLEVVTRWMNMRNIWFLLGFRNGLFLMRVDTPNPLDNPKRINAMLKTMLKDAQILELKASEETALKRAQSTASSQAPALKDEAEGTQVSSKALQLEEDKTSPKTGGPDDNTDDSS